VKSKPNSPANGPSHEDPLRIYEQPKTIGAKVLWSQPETDTDEAAAVAAEAGITVVRRRCMGVTVTGRHGQSRGLTKLDLFGIAGNGGVE
jgi:hypothetical protein